MLEIATDHSHILSVPSKHRQVCIYPAESPILPSRIRSKITNDCCATMTSHPRLSEARDYIQRLTCYKFVNIDWLEEALWAYPVTMACGRYLKDGNKSLAVVGDAVLNLVVTSECYKPGIIRGMCKTQGAQGRF